MFSILSGIVTGLSSYVPPGLLTFCAAAFIADGSLCSTFTDEFIGTVLMIGLTFSPGKWIATTSTLAAWAVHAVGVVAADKIGGGQHVNPSVSLAMFSLGKCSYTEMLVRIAGAMSGGLCAFPFFQVLAEKLDWTPLGGPEYNSEGDEDASASGASEFFAAFLLMIMIYVLNWELNFGKHHYWIKQTLTALGIRFLIEVFPTAGPAINPMLGTTWAVHAYGSYPEDVRHYFVYWVASGLGALAASLAYAVYSGTTFFGMKVADGPESKSKDSKKKK
jgi:glycerol uptake facilitator-like aquaporin